MDKTILIELSYILSAVLFIYGIKMLSSADTARRGNRISALGMFIAVVATLLLQGMQFQYIIAGVIIGGTIGTVAAVRIQMTSMPEFVALFNGTGGLASLLVGWAEYQARMGDWTEGVPGEEVVSVVAIFLAVLIGGVTFTGSLIACGKLAEIPWRIESRLKKSDTGPVASILKAVRRPLDLMLDSKPVMYPGQQIVNSVLFALVLACGAAFVYDPADPVPTNGGGL